MARRVAIIFGSPSKGSNTHILVKEAQRGLQERGVDSEVHFLNDLNIRGCQSCYYCKKTDTTTCALHDDMQGIYDAMESADGIIVASPIYWANVTAQTKLWQDRLFPYLGMDMVGKMPGHKIARFIFTQNQPDPTLFTEHVETFMRMVGMVGFEVKGYVLAADLARGLKPMVNENGDDMKKAYDLGRTFFA